MTNDTRNETKAATGELKAGGVRRDWSSCDLQGWGKASLPTALRCHASPSSAEAFLGRRSVPLDICASLSSLAKRGSGRPSATLAEHPCSLSGRSEPHVTERISARLTGSWAILAAPHPLFLPPFTEVTPQQQVNT